jgi:co-chaperonin GroES (HSP10)
MKVVAVGPTCEQIKAGDTVMVHPTTEGLVIDVNGEDYVMVNEFQICGRFE